MFAFLKSKEDQKKIEDAYNQALREEVAAKQDLVYKGQALTKGVRDETRARSDLNKETTDYTKNARQLTRITNVNRKAFTQLARDTNKLRRDTESLHSANVTLVQDNAKVAKGMNSLADATKRTARERKKYNELRKTEGVTAKQLEQQSVRIVDAHEAEDRAIQSVKASLVEVIQQRRNHDVVMRQNAKSLRDLTQDAIDTGLRAAKVRADKQADISQNATVLRQFDRIGDATQKVSREYRKFNDMSRDVSVSSAALATQVEKVNDAYVAQQRAVADASVALDQHYRQQEAADKRAEEAEQRAEARARAQELRDRRKIMPQSAGQYIARNVGALTPLGTLSPSVLIPVAAIIGTVGEAVVTASQAIATLPAVATAAAAGIGTLTVGMWGFGDALKGMSDPKKFAEALFNLSPNAQQAALSIKNLVDGPLGDLKRATQDALFANVSPTLQKLAQTFGPMMQGMLTSIATSFNRMFTGISFEFMTPETQQRVETITTNIADMFDRLTPGVLALVSAFTKIAETGSGFLPGLADGFTGLMVSFDNFITKAQEDGSLQNFMSKGIEAVKAISKWLLQFGQDIYKVFGNKSPQDFIDMMNTVREVAVGLIELFRGIASVMDALAPIIKNIVDAFGGWENVMWGLVGGGIFMGLYKFIKWGKEFATVFGLIGPSAVKAAQGIGALNTASTIAAGGASVTAAAKQSAATTASTFAAAGTAAGTGFGSKLMLAIRGLGWASLGVGIAASISQGIRSFKGPDNSQGTNNTLDDLANGFDMGKILNPDYWLDKYLNDGRGYPRDQHSFDIATGGGAPSAKIGPTQGPGIPENDYPNGMPNPWDDLLKNLPDFSNIPDFPLPNVPLDENGKALTDSEILNQIRGQIPRDQFAVDPFTDPITGQKISPMLPIGPNGMPEYPTGGTPGTPSIQGPIMPKRNAFGQITGYGANLVDPEAVFDAQLAVQDRARDLEEANKDLLAAKQAGILSAEEVNDLDRKVTDQKLQLHKALVRLGEAQTGDFEKLKTKTDRAKNALGDFGAEIDKDFGISKGLSGIAENLTKFIANLAFAPVFGAIRGAQAGLGFPEGEGAGSGLMGMAASSMGWYKGGPMDPEAQAERIQAQTQGSYTPTYPGSRPATTPVATPAGAPLAAEAGYRPSASPGASPLRLNPNNVSTAGLKPQSMALLGLIQGMPQFKNIPLTSAKAGREGDPYPWHGHGQGLDLGLDAYNPEQSALGDQLKTFLESNKELFGINHVLWKTMQGGNHFNHLHVGLNGSSIGKPDTSPLLQGMGGVVPPAGGTSLASLGSGIPIPLPVTIVGGAAGAAGLPTITPPPGTPAAANSTLPIPAAGNPGGAPGSTGSMRDEAVTKVWTVEPDGSIVWRTSYGNPTAAPKGQSGKPATTPPSVAASPPAPPAPPSASFLPPGLVPRRYAKGGEVPIIAHSGEHVLTRDDVSAMGGQRGVYDFRRSLHYEQGGPVQPTDLGGLLGVGDAPPPPPPPPPPKPPAPPKLPEPPTPPGPPATDFGPPLAAEAGAPPVAGVPQVAQIPETAMPSGVETPGTVIGANVEAPAGYGGGLSIGGGIIGALQGAAGTAIQAAGLAADVAGGFGGGSAGAAVASSAMQIGFEELNRAIEYGGQVAAIGVQGLLETFLPAGGSELAQNNWLTRFAGGIAGAAPAIANLAGGATASNQDMLAGVGAGLVPRRYAKGGEVPIIAHSGEHVLTRDDVSAMGGQRGVYDFRRSLHYEQGGPVQPTDLGGLLGVGDAPPPPPPPPPPKPPAPPKLPEPPTPPGPPATDFGPPLAAEAGAPPVAGVPQVAQNNWLTRFAGGIAGAAPAIANLAGGATASNQDMLAGVGATPEQIAAQGMDPNRSQHTGSAPQPGPYTGVSIQNYNVVATEDRAGQDLARYQPASGAR